MKELYWCGKDSDGNIMIAEVHPLNPGWKAKLSHFVTDKVFYSKGYNEVWQTGGAIATLSENQIIKTPNKVVEFIFESI